MTKEEKQKIFEPISRNFETENIKAFYGYGRRNSRLHIYNAK